MLTQKEKDFYLKKREKGKEIQVKVDEELGWQLYLGTEFDHEIGEYRVKPKAKKLYFMIKEERLHSFRQELVIAANYNEAYLTYVHQIVKPMLKEQVEITLISKKMAYHPDAPMFPKKFKGKKVLKEKERDFFIEYKEKTYIVKAISFDNAVEILKSKVKKFDKYEVTIRIAADFLIKKTKRLN